QIAYDPQNRTALVLQQGMVTNVTFDVMERIERVVLPDENGPVGLLKADKEVNQAPLINNLPLFGASPGNTDMVVITVSPEGKERPYLFALTLVAAPREGGGERGALPVRADGGRGAEGWRGSLGGDIQPLIHLPDPGEGRSAGHGA